MIELPNLARNSIPIKLLNDRDKFILAKKEGMIDILLELI